MAKNRVLYNLVCFNEKLAIILTIVCFDKIPFDKIPFVNYAHSIVALSDLISLRVLQKASINVFLLYNVNSTNTSAKFEVELSIYLRQKITASRNCQK